MITRDRYIAMAANAVEQFHRLSTVIPYGTEIVYVVSREVYQAMQMESHYDTWNINLTAEDVIETYCGARLACINENVAENFFMPVVYSGNFQHYNGLQVNDFVIFNDEDNDFLFRLARLTPDAMYTDTGLTVSFMQIHVPANAAIDNAVANLADNATTIGDATTEIEHTVGTEMERAIADLTADLERAAEVVRAMPITTINLYGAEINMDMLQELAGCINAAPRARKRANKENELNPGDTKLIDEYLNSFLKGGC